MYTYEFDLEKNELIGHLKDLYKCDDLVYRFGNLDMSHHSLDTLTYEFCPNLRLCRNDFEYKRLLRSYIIKLEYLKICGFNRIGFAYDITGREKNVLDKIYICEGFSHRFKRDRVKKVITDGDKSYIDLDGNVFSDSYDIKVYSKLNDFTYWFESTYNLDKFAISFDTINLINLDIDFSFLPVNLEFSDYKISIPNNVCDEIVNASDYIDLGRFVNREKILKRG